MKFPISICTLERRGKSVENISHSPKHRDQDQKLSDWIWQSETKEWIERMKEEEEKQRNIVAHAITMNIRNGP